MDVFRVVFLLFFRVYEKEEFFLILISGFDNYRGLINLCFIFLVRDYILRNEVYLFICGIYFFR